MKKKILALLFSLALCLCVAVPAFAAEEDFTNEYSRVQDLAGLLSKSEEAALTDKLDELSVRQSLEVVVMTTNSLEGRTVPDYAETFYEYCDFGYGANKDGVLLLISMEDHDWYMATHGYGITVFTDAGIQYIGGKIKEELSDGNFYAAFDSFADLCDDFITQAKIGEPYDVSNLPKEPLSLIWIPISLAAGLFLSLAAVGKMKAKLKTVRFQAAAGSYQKDGSMNITESRDLYLYHTITKTAKPKNNSSSSSGGSSTHTSSSGGTYGGGGGKF